MPIKGKQVINGKAFEYSIAMQYFNYLHDLGLNVCLIENKAYATAYKSYNEVSEEEKNKFNQAAFNTIDTLIKIEPGLITQKNENDTLNISINTDQSGENGDVRDIIFQRKESKWEIGISAKNNNDAVKHSRLSNSADFGLSWFGVPCSKDYWAEIQPVFNYIEECIASKLTWKNVNDKKTQSLCAITNCIQERVNAHISSQ